MPWCETCDRFYNPRSVAPDGTCSTCGRFIAEQDDGDDAAAARIPWHFWLLVVGLVVYLGWRLIDFIAWLIT